MAGTQRSEISFADVLGVEVAPGFHWADPVWRFPVTVAGTRPTVFTMRWNFEVLPGVKLTDPEHAELLDGWRHVFWTLLTKPGDGHIRRRSVCAKFSTSLRSLVPWMLSTDRSDLGHINLNCVSSYAEHLAGRVANGDGFDRDSFDKTSTSGVSYFHIFTYAWWARTALAEAGHPAPDDRDPLAGRAAHDWAKDVFFRALKKTPEISDPIFITTMNGAEDAIRRERVEPLIALCNKLPGGGNEMAKELCSRFLETNTSDYSHLQAIHAVRLHVVDVRAACHTLLQGSSGIRISEVCGIEAGAYSRKLRLPSCVQIERSFDDQYEIFYLEGTLFKGTGGEKRVRWVLGMRPTGSDYLPSPVRAIDILFRMDAGWRKQAGIAELLIGFPSVKSFPREAMPVVPATSDGLRSRQQEWMDLKRYTPSGYRVTTHMWRKTFARYMIKVSAGLLPALSRHFKHMSVAFTEVAYCQPDPEARQLISDARVEETGAFLLGLVTGKKPVAGPMAAELNELAHELRGRFGNRLDDEMRTELSHTAKSRGVQIHHEDFGFCVFRGDGARCHQLAENPLLPLLRVAPAHALKTPDICRSCRNFGIDQTHLPFWTERRQASQMRLDALGPNAPPGYRASVKQEIARCDTVLGWMGADGAA